MDYAPADAFASVRGAFFRDHRLPKNLRRGRMTVAYPFAPSGSEGLLDFVETNRSGVSHDLKASQRLDITRRASLGHHADALDFVPGRILRSILYDLILRHAFITHARGFVPAGHNGAARCRFATLADVEFRNVISSRENRSCGSKEQNGERRRAWASRHDHLTPQIPVECRGRG
jgi:hypothetical protein